MHSIALHRVPFRCRGARGGWGSARATSIRRSCNDVLFQGTEACDRGGCLTHEVSSNRRELTTLNGRISEDPGDRSVDDLAVSLDSQAVTMIRHPSVVPGKHCAVWATIGTPLVGGSPATILSTCGMTGCSWRPPSSRRLLQHSPPARHRSDPCRRLWCVRVARPRERGRVAPRSDFTDSSRSPAALSAGGTVTFVAATGGHCFTSPLEVWVGPL